MTTGPFDWAVVLPLTQSKTVYDSRPGFPPVVSYRNQASAESATYKRPISIKTVPSPSGWRPPTPWTSQRSHTVKYAKGVMVVYEAQRPALPSNWRDFQYVLTEGYSCYPLQPTPFNPSFGKLEDRAITKALLKLKDQKVNLAVAFAERKESAELFETAAKRIVSDVLGFKRNMAGEIRRVAVSGYYRKTVRFNGRPGRRYGRVYREWQVMQDVMNRRVRAGATLSNAWLELTYGWRPFMQDLYGSVEAIYDANRGHDASRCTVTASVRDSNTTRFELSMCSNNWSSTQSFAWFQMRQVETLTCHVSLSYVLANEILHSMAQMGITNPAELVWERIPFSFVIDWFLPVGNFLQTLDADFGMKWIGGSCGKLARRAITCTGIRQKKYVQGNSSLELGYYDGSRPSDIRHTFDREVYLSSPLPTVPRFKNPISYAHIANAMALLRSVGSLASFVKR